MKMKQAGEGQVSRESESGTCWQETTVESYAALPSGKLYFEEQSWKNRFGSH